MSYQDHPPTKTSLKKRAWSAYIPRPGSSSGSKPSSSNGGNSATTGVSSPTSLGPRSGNGFGFGKRPGSRSKDTVSALTTPQEGKELEQFLPFQQTPTSSRSTSSSLNASANSSSSTLAHFVQETPLSGARAADAGRRTPPSRPSSRPSTPKRWASSLLTSSPENEAPRSSSEHTRMASGKSYLSSMIGGLSLSISRTSTRDSAYAPEEEEEREREKDRGRTIFKPGSKRTKSQETDTPATSRSRSRARSQSPFFFRRRQRDRDTSPTIQSLPLANSETDLSDTSSIQPRTAFTDFADSGDETIGETDYSDDDCDDFDDFLDPVTERNTEHNAIVNPAPAPDAVIDEAEPDPLGEGVNVVVPPEPYFPSTLNSLDRSNTRNKKNPRRRKSVKHHEPLPFKTCRPIFERDRCTITVKQGDPKLSTRRKRKYVVASDLSEESKYAVEWGIGTVLRDGDEMLVVTVVENDNKGELDPEVFNPTDRTAKLRSQQERQGLAYILVRQVTGLLQRTRLNVAVSCQAWHAKNARHMLLDIVDYTQPTMLIVGSRGLSQLSGILLGSTSHYLIQKCSVPVMVARRRLKRPPKKSAHLSTHRQHVKLSEAGIDRVAAKVDQDVQVMREEMQKDDKKRDGGPGSRDDRQAEALLEAAEDDEGEEGEGSVSGENEGGRSPEAVGKEGDSEASERVST